MTSPLSRQSTSRVVGFVVEDDRGAYTIYEPTDEMVERAAEAMEDAALRLLGRDLGTRHRDDIARAALEAALHPKEDTAA